MAAGKNITRNGRLLLLGVTAAWLALTATARAQQQISEWRVYRVADGLPEPACTSVNIGLNGKILVTHPNSEFVSELDGYTIKTIPRPGVDSGRVCESPGGQMWAIAPEGLKKWTDNVWTVCPVPEIAAEFRKNPRPAYSIPFLPVQQNRVLVLLPDRLMEFNAEGLNRSQTAGLRTASQTQIGTFSSMSLARNGGLWITGARGLAKAPGPTRNLKSIDPWQEHIPPSSLEIQNLREPREDEDGGVTLVADSASTGQKIGVYFDGQHWTVLPFGSEKIRYAWRESSKVFWAVTADSLLRWQDGQFAESEEISARQYFDMTIQPDGGIWLATSDGLFRYAPPAWRIPSALDKVNSHIRCVSEDSDGRLWFVAGGKLHSLQNDVQEEFTLPEAVQNAQACSLFLLKNGTLLLASMEKLFWFQPGSGLFNPVNTTNDLGSRTVIGAFRDGSVCIKVFTQDGAATSQLEKYDGLRFQSFPAPLPDAVIGDAFSILFAAQNGDLWLGGERGVAYWHDEKWRTFVSSDKTTPEKVRCFVELADGKIWCGTSDKIWEFDGRNWSVARAEFDRLNTLLRGSDGSIWAASDGGLHRFWQGAWIENGLEEGLLGTTVHEVYEDQQSRIWAATSRGLSRYFPKADTDPPKTQIRKLADENQKIFEGATLNFLFNGQDKWKFTPRNRLLHSYRLDRHEWSLFQELGVVSWPDLSAGKHSFQIRAMDRNGNIEPPVQLEFAVAMPWYREMRLVLISLAGLATAIFFAALAVNRHRQLLRSYSEVEKKVAQRTCELEIANRELLHSQKMNALGTLAAGIAHDFNNILSIVKGSAQIIEDNTGSPEKIRTRVDRIKTVVQQGAEIVDAMLGFSRSSDSPAAPCDVNAVVGDTMKLLGDRFLREVEVKFERAQKLPEISAPRDFIQQILLNFIFNAAEAMTGRKQITLTTHVAEALPPEIFLTPTPAVSYILISVRDCGSGIAPEIKPRIFEPFFTTKALSTKRGTGLGLSMVYELAKKMEAGLAVESVVSQGSLFTLILPARKLQSGKHPEP